MRTLSSVLLAIALTGAAGLLGGCSDDRFERGYATYWVEFYDYVIDRYGMTQNAYCGGYVTFYGDIDTACSRLPMVWSYEQYSYMDCTYRDAAGLPHYYYDLYYFWPGYIQDAECEPGYQYPEPPADMDPNAMSTLSRDAESRVIADDDVMLSSAPTPLETLREAIRARRGAEDPPPSDLPPDLPTTVRTSEVMFGEPPDAGPLPDAGPPPDAGRPPPTDGGARPDAG